MNHLKVVETSRTGYNTQSVIKTPVAMETKPVNPERAVAWLATQGCTLSKVMMHIVWTYSASRAEMFGMCLLGCVGKW